MSALHIPLRPLFELIKIITLGILNYSHFLWICNLFLITSYFWNESWILKKIWFCNEKSVKIVKRKVTTICITCVTNVSYSIIKIILKKTVFLKCIFSLHAYFHVCMQMCGEKLIYYSKVLTLYDCKSTYYLKL